MYSKFFIGIILLMCSAHVARSSSDVRCEIDDDCPTSLVCRDQEFGPKICLMKSVAHDFGMRDILTIVALFLGGGVSAAGGVGGGGLFIPFLVLIMGVSPLIATPLANAAVLGGAIANFLQNVFAKHPIVDRPLIDFWAGLMFELNTLSGTVIGVLLYVIFPMWLEIALFFALFGLTTLRTCQNAITVWRLEKKTLIIPNDENLEIKNDDRGGFGIGIGAAEFQSGAEKIISKTPKANVGDGFNHPDVVVGNLQQNESTSGSEEKTKLLLESGFSQYTTTTSAATPYNEQHKRMALDLVERERSIPWDSVVIQIGAWMFILGLDFIKGGDGAPSVIGLTHCAPSWWIATFVSMPLMALATYLVGVKLRQTHELKVAVGYPFQKGDIQWTSKNISRIPVFCIFAGIFAGLFGIGGSLVKGPLMLELGVLPQVSAATSTYMILFTASTTVIQFLIIGRLPWDYFLLYSSVGFLSCAIGHDVIKFLVKKYRKASLVIFSVAVVLFLSTVLMGVQGTLNVVRQAKSDPDSLFFSPVC